MPSLSPSDETVNLPVYSFALSGFWLAMMRSPLGSISDVASTMDVVDAVVVAVLVKPAAAAAGARSAVAPCSRCPWCRRRRSRYRKATTRAR